MSPLLLPPARTAVLCMDYQGFIVANFVRPTNADTLLARAQSVLTAARANQVRVIYVVVGFRPGFPEASSRNKFFASMERATALQGPGGAIHTAVTPHEGDVVIARHRAGAFHGTDLDVILRANDVDTLVLMGISTSGVVLSTVRYAADADYRIVVVSDACADSDPEVHACLMEKVYPRQASVATAADVIHALGTPGPSTPS
jgi:nicotinamidase-related amidase